MSEKEVRFCIRCGASLAQMERHGRLRPVCPACGWIYFPDPKVAVAVVVLVEDKVLLVSRLNEPFQGRWSLPAGFMDAGEDPRLAAERECREETGLNIRVNTLFDVLSGRAHPNGADLLLVYLAEVVGGQIQPGDDAGQAAFFPLDRLPELAFESTARVLERLRRRVDKAET